MWKRSLRVIDCMEDWVSLVLALVATNKRNLREHKTQTRISFANWHNQKDSFLAATCYYSSFLQSLLRNVMRVSLDGFWVKTNSQIELANTPSHCPVTWMCFSCGRNNLGGGTLLRVKIQVGGGVEKNGGGCGIATPRKSTSLVCNHEKCISDLNFC